MRMLGGIPYELVHEVRGRMRLRPRDPARRCAREDIEKSARFPGLKTDIIVSERTGSVLIVYAPDAVCGGIQNPANRLPKLADERRETAKRADVRNPVPLKVFSLVFPGALNAILAVVRAVPFIMQGLGELFSGKLGLRTLDAAALGICILRRDFRALSSIVFFFALGAFLEFRTRKKSRDDLACSLALNITRVRVRANEAEYELPVEELRTGDTVVVRTGSVIPVDGCVEEGEALVNQASMTGEPLPVRRAAGASVYAGTVVEEGELYIRVLKAGGERRIDAVIRHIEESESAKAGIQSKYERIADGIVPYNFLLALLVYLFTRDAARAGAVLLVDYSCALRLTTPLTILAAMSEAARRGMLIKGGRALEALHEADTAVFDKTGTLTEAKPEVAEIIPFGAHDADDILRLAACLEEHFPHPVGRAVVSAAEQKGLKHREKHAEVEFIVAHGLASRLRGKQALIGSEHFIVEDMGVRLTAKQKKIARERAERGETLLYLVTGEALVGLIVIKDNVRPGMLEFIAALRQSGFRRIVMLTGDGETTAAAVAQQTGIMEFKARLLPEHKTEYIAGLQLEGARVLMMGDGINDASALSKADAGVALKSGADITREIADIVLTRGNPADLLPALELAALAIRRIRSNFYLSLGWNSLFLAAALGGVVSPGISAFLHNACTSALAVRSMTPFLPEEGSGISAGPARRSGKNGRKR